MKNKILIFGFVTMISLLFCSIGVVASNVGSEKIIDPSTGVEYTKEEKELMIEQRKADKIKYGTKTAAEIAREEGYEDRYLEIKKIEESIFSSEENRKWRAELDKASSETEKTVREQISIEIALVTKYGYYPEGVDSARIDYDEDYMLDFMIAVCKAYSDHKNEISTSDRSAIEANLNGVYDNITSWFPQSDKSMDAYEMIEKTIDVQHYSTSVERR